MVKIIDTSRSLTRVGDTSTALRCIDTKKVAVTLGARPARRLNRGAKGPLSFLALAEVIGRQLASTGGRPALESAEPRQKIPPHKGDWQKLKRIAAQLKRQGVRCTPGQVASVLLHDQIERLEALAAGVGTGNLLQPKIHRNSSSPALRRPRYS
jgi:hypothetical protein